ncbi:MAG: deoxyhypusine synthase [Candidatus Thermoplasmatota archaeon]
MLEQKMKKDEFLSEKICHIDVKEFDSTPIIDFFEKMSFQARNIAQAAKIYKKMIEEKNCTIILCLSGSLISAGMKKVIVDLVKHNMVDVIISSGAIIVDQDFFEGLGFNHYRGTPFINDELLRKKRIDRIYDTFIDENDLRICDMTISKIANQLNHGVYSSREFIMEMGKHLKEKKTNRESVVLECYRKHVPIFVPAFSDCSAGFGLLHHQYNKQNERKVSIDSVKDILELTEIKSQSKNTGVFIIGGGVPKNFAQDVTVSADIINKDVNMHKYAIQITVADVRDGGLSGSTLKEAHSWGKIDDTFEQMVYAEASIAFPLIASFVYHQSNWKKRKARNLNRLLDQKK